MQFDLIYFSILLHKEALWKSSVHVLLLILFVSIILAFAVVVIKRKQYILCALLCHISF